MYYKHANAMLKFVDSGLLTVSKAGLIRNTETGREWRSLSNNGKYIVVDFRHKNKRYYIRAHALVCLVFIGPIPKGYEPNHKDGVKDNNALSNLEIITHKENMEHAAKLGLTPVGQDKSDAKLTDKNVVEIRNQFRSGIGVNKLARKFHVASRVIVKAILGINWKHVPGSLTLKEYNNVVNNKTHSQAKISKELVIKIRKLYNKEKYTAEEIATKVNLTREAVRNIVTGKSWNTLPLAIPMEKFIEIEQSLEQNRKIFDENPHFIRKVKRFSQSNSERITSIKFNISRAKLRKIKEGAYDVILQSA